MMKKMMRPKLRDRWKRRKEKIWKKRERERKKSKWPNIKTNL